MISGYELKSRLAVGLLFVIAGIFIKFITFGDGYKQQIFECDVVQNKCEVSAVTVTNFNNKRSWQLPGPADITEIVVQRSTKRVHKKYRKGWRSVTVYHIEYRTDIAGKSLGSVFSYDFADYSDAKKVADDLNTLLKTSNGKIKYTLKR